MRCLLSLLPALALGCSAQLFPGRPKPEAASVRPSQVLDFGLLYADNCAGCHGPAGRNGASVELADPLYLAFADDAVLRRVTAQGIPGTAMSAFAQSAGGSLTEAQVEALVQGIRRWAKPDAVGGAERPPYAAVGPADVQAGGGGSQRAKDPGPANLD